MMQVGKTDHTTLRGWPAVGAFAIITITRVLTAFVVSYPITWLVRQIFTTSSLLQFVLGAGGLTYWRCVDLFMIWHAVRIKIKFSAR